jgi:hypothetical protein
VLDGMSMEQKIQVSFKIRSYVENVDKNNRMKGFRKFYAFSLLIVGLFLFGAFLAGGHSVHVKDSAQLLLFLEIILFCGTSVCLFVENSAQSRIHPWLLMFLLIGVQLALVDIFFEVSKIDFEETPFFLVGVYAIVFIANIYFIYLQVRRIRGEK